jgi:hypothetical protein
VSNNNGKEDFKLRVTKPDGTEKEMFYTTVVGVLIDRNDDAKKLSNLFVAADAIRRGELVDGKDINMNGYTFQRI